MHLKHGRLNTVPDPIIPGHVSVGTVFAVSGHVVDVEGREVHFCTSASAHRSWLWLWLRLDDLRSRCVQVTRGMTVTFLDVIDTCNSCVACLVPPTPQTQSPGLEPENLK